MQFLSELSQHCIMNTMKIDFVSAVIDIRDWILLWSICSSTYFLSTKFKKQHIQISIEIRKEYLMSQVISIVWYLISIQYCIISMPWKFLFDENYVLSQFFKINEKKIDGKSKDKQKTTSEKNKDFINVVIFFYFIEILSIIK